MKPKAIIVDLDGTLCDSEHRAHHVKNSPKNWSAFYDAMIHDKPNYWCHELMSGMTNRAEIIFVTGRPEKYRSLTLEWLAKHHLFGGRELFMRKDGDFRRDTDIKVEIYREHIEPRFNVLFCIEDRKQVVDAWRAIGLPCLQCAEGDF